MSGLWDYRNCVWDQRESTWTLDKDLVGYVVEGAEGPIGSVVQASSTSVIAFLVVEIAPPLHGIRLVPAGVVTSMRHADRVVCIDLTRAQLRDAPAHAGDLGDHAAQDGYFSSLSR